MPRFLSGASPWRLVMLLLLFVACVVGPFLSFSLLAWASSRAPPGGDTASDDAGNRLLELRPGVSLGPDAIPPVIRFKRRLPAASDSSGPARPGGQRKRLGDGDISDAEASLAVVALSEGGGGNTPPHGCRNTVQGMEILADSEGRVCRRTDRDVHRPGCCAARPLRSKEGELSGAVTDTLAARGRHEGKLTPRPHDNAKHAEVRLEATEDVQLSASPLVVPLAGVAGNPLGSSEDGFPPEEALSTPFSCWSCDAGDGGSSCCLSYEFCVACCQDPRREEEREAIRSAAARSGHPAYSSFGYGGSESIGGKPSARLLLSAEQEESRGGGGEGGEGGGRKALAMPFEYCAFRCRTYSGSVAHENSFRGPLKHCFGRFRPPATPGLSANSDGRRKSGNPSGAGTAVTPPLQLDPFLARFMSD